MADGRARFGPPRQQLVAEIERLRRWVSDLQSGMYVNCVYCGHRYGPGETTPVSMADALKAHVERCPEHPMAQLRELHHGGRRYPVELTPELRHVLGMRVCTTRPVAHLFRDAGYAIEREIEAEQAFVLHWLITLVLDHGAEWGKHAALKIDQLKIVAKARAGDEAAEKRARGPNVPPLTEGFDPSDCFYGSMHAPENAARLRRDIERLDLQMKLEAPPHAKWYGVEKDDSRGRALPEHMEAHEKARGRLP